MRISPANSAVLLGSALILIGACANVGATTAQDARKSTRDDAAITVSATAEIEAPPEEVRVNLAVISEAPNPADALEDNNRRMERVVRALRTLGLEEEELETTRVAVRPNYRYDQREGQRIIGYIVENHVRATTTRLDLAGRIIQEGVDAGASSVASVSFGLVDEQPFRLRAIAAATRKARAEADAAADAAGVRIVRVRSIHIGGVHSPPIPLARGMEADMAAARTAPSQPPVSPGDITVRAIVTATFDIE